MALSNNLSYIQALDFAKRAYNIDGTGYLVEDIIKIKKKTAEMGRELYNHEVLKVVGLWKNDLERIKETPIETRPVIFSSGQKELEKNTGEKSTGEYSPLEKNKVENIRVEKNTGEKELEKIISSTGEYSKVEEIQLEKNQPEYSPVEKNTGEKSKSRGRPSKYREKEALVKDLMNEGQSQVEINQITGIPIRTLRDIMKKIRESS